MSLRPFVRTKQVYSLDWGAFSTGAHLKLLSERESKIAGLDAERQNLEVLFCDPKEGDPRIVHGMTASITPSFRGLDGTFTVEGRPESRLLPVVKAVGLKLYGTFDQSASSVDDGGDWTGFTRRRFIPNGGKTLTGGPDGTWESEVIWASLVTERGDEFDDFAPVTAEAIAASGTLMPGDILIHPVHGTFQVRGVLPQGEFEKARLER